MTTAPDTPPQRAGRLRAVTDTPRTGHQPPPHDLDAERAVLSCALHTPAARAWLAEHLTEDHYYDHTHRVIHTAICDLERAGEHVDVLTVRRRLLTLGITEIPDQYLIQILEAAPLTAAYEVYGQIVADHARIRAYLDQAAILRAGLADPTRDPDQLVTQAMQRLTELLNPPDQAAYTGQALVEALHELIDLSTGEAKAHWGLTDLDAITRGLLPSRLILLAARPGVGKSSLAIQAAATAAAKAPVLLWSYEMSAGEVAAHVVAATRHIPLREILHGAALTDQRSIAGFQELAELPLTVRTDSPDLTALVSATAAHHARQPLGLVVVDYLQLVPVAATSKSGNREQEVSEVARALRHLAARLQVPVLACAQLNRNADGKMPALADLRDSGALEQEAHQVIFLHRTSDAASYVDGLVAKNRMGRVARFRLAWRPQMTAFANYTQGT